MSISLRVSKHEYSIGISEAESIIVDLQRQIAHEREREKKERLNEIAALESRLKALKENS